MTIHDALKEHARQEAPRECCGLVVVYKGREKYIPCKNIHPTPEQDFYIDPLDYIKAEEMGEVVAVCHSHPMRDSSPSEVDKVAHKRSGVKWVIVGKEEDIIELPATDPFIELFGRKYIHGVSDCYSFVRDFYKQELNIILPDYYREDEWWEKGGNLYLDNYEDAGFYEVEFDKMQYGDLLVLGMVSSVPNHGAIYYGGNKIAHHLQGRLSSIDVYGQFFMERTYKVLRHKEYVA